MVKIGNDQYTEQSEKNSNSKNRDGVKIRFFYLISGTKKTYPKPREQLYPNSCPLKLNAAMHMHLNSSDTSRSVQS